MLGTLHAATVRTACTLADERCLSGGQHKHYACTYWYWKTSCSAVLCARTLAREGCVFYYTSGPVLDRASGLPLQEPDDELSLTVEVVSLIFTMSCRHVRFSL
jgi:hypothetical protein